MWSSRIPVSAGGNAGANWWREGVLTLGVGALLGVDSVIKAISLNGQRLDGAPIIVMLTQAEKNRCVGGQGAEV
jgi:hypothetical protein